VNLSALSLRALQFDRQPTASKAAHLAIVSSTRM